MRDESVLIKVVRTDGNELYLRCDTDDVSKTRGAQFNPLNSIPDR